MKQWRWACLLTCLSLLFAPWAFGTTEAWSRITLQVLVASALLVSLAGWRNERDRTERHVMNGRGSGPALALGLYIGLQAANASHRYQEVDQSLIPQPHVGWLPHSVDAAATWHTLGQYLTYVVLFWIVRASFSELTRRTFLVNVLILSGFVMALLAILQTCSGAGKIFWVRASRFSSGFLGPFVNPNNYAAYMNLLIPVALTMAHSAQRDAKACQHRSRPGYLLYFFAAVMIVSVFLSKSRAGVILCVGLVLSWVFLTWFQRRQSRQGELSSLLFAFCLLVAISIGLLSFLGFGLIATEMATLKHVSAEWSGSRGMVYQATWKMFQARWLFGVGAGTFPCAFPYYQPDTLSGFWRYAHNDWLQYLAELGLMGSVLLAAFGFRALWPKRVVECGNQFAGKNPLMRHDLATAFLLALAGVALHACVDFPLHIPGIACLAVAYCALFSNERRG